MPALDPARPAAESPRPPTCPILKLVFARVALALLLGASLSCFRDDPPPLGGSSGGSTDAGSSTHAHDTSGTGAPTSSSSITSSPSSSSSSSSAGTDLTTTTTASTGDACPDGQPERPFYADADMDGYGAGAPVATGCDPPPGAVELAGDCDDQDLEINPGALERCNDLVDDDCDGLFDEYSTANPACGPCGMTATATASYWACTGALTFLAAETRCQQFGATVHLANPADSSEHATLLALVKAQLPAPGPSQLQFWLGIRRAEALWNDCGASKEPSAWIALDGSPVTYLPWALSEPNNFGCDKVCTTDLLDDPACLRENCVELWTYAPGDYNDSYCTVSGSLGYACKAPL